MVLDEQDKRALLDDEGEEMGEEWVRHNVYLPLSVSRYYKVRASRLGLKMSQVIRLALIEVMEMHNGKGTE